MLSALKYNFQFIKDEFMPIVNQVKQTNFHLSNNYLGSLFGMNRSKEFQNFEYKTINHPPTIKNKINIGLKAARQSKAEPHYVSFFVVTKHGYKDTADDKHMDMHACVYTVRAMGDVKDSIHFDPSGEAFRHAIPDFLVETRLPIMASRTRQCGTTTQVDDCFFQCMKYILGLATGEKTFCPDLTQPY